MILSRLALCCLLALPCGAMFAQGNSWTTGSPISIARVAPGAAAVNDTLYVIGGFTDSAGAYATVEAYDTTSKSWSPRASMNTARGRVAIAVMDSLIFAVGGFGGENAVESYNVFTNTWTTRASIQQGRLAAAAGVINGKLYVAGGTSFDTVNTLEEYDPVGNSWSFKAPMPTPRFLLAGGVIGSKFYVVGGANSYTGGSGLGTLEIYDPASNTWDTTKAKMPTPRSDLAAAVINGKLYVTGGFGDGGNHLEIYDPVQNSWSTGDSMSASRGDIAAAALDGKFYAIGGTAAPGMTPLKTVEIYTPGQIQTSVEVSQQDQIPQEFSLSQNYPNPFNPSTTITFTVSSRTFVSLVVYNILGQQVATLVNDVLSPGTHRVVWNASSMAGGVYFYQMRANGFSETRRLVLVK